MSRGSANFGSCCLTRHDQSSCANLTAALAAESAADIVGSRKLVPRQQLAQRTQPGLVIAPALDRTAIDRLARLPHAGGGHDALVALRVQAGIVPIQAAERDQPPCRGFAIGNQGLVVHLQEAVGRQHGAPVIHQTLVLPILPDQIVPVAGEAHAPEEIRAIDRQAGIDRVTPAMDDPGAREHQMHQAEPHEIMRQLVGDPRGVRRDPTQHRAIVVRQKIGRRLGTGCPGRHPPKLCPRCSQNSNSPPPAISGWLEMTCSTSVVPERGMPSTNIGVSSSTPRPAWCAKNSGVKRAMSWSTHAACPARS